MSSPYPILGNRPIDQWKVTELKEELKRRKLTIKGLKDDLIKRLDEALRVESQQIAEIEASKQAASPQSVSEKLNVARSSETETAEATRDEAIRADTHEFHLNSTAGPCEIVEEKIQDEVVAQETVPENDLQAAPTVSKNDIEYKSDGEQLENVASPAVMNNIEPKPQLEDDGLKVSEEEMPFESSSPANQVSEIHPNLGFSAKSNSISIDSLQLRNNNFGDTVKLELDNIDPDMSIKGETLDLGDSEKLNLDRSDDSMEEDIVESKDQIKENLMDQNHLDSDNLLESAFRTNKRKRYDEEEMPKNDESKRQRRWNSETKKIVPPSRNPPTNSLRIDRFLRPFTLKAVQELLGETGKVVRFWMDQIRTHCYVTYSSVEEAMETRNAVHNLQWPSNGGRLLTAEFVDPQEVVRVEAASVLVAPVAQEQPFQRDVVSRQRLPSPPLPPPPPLFKARITTDQSAHLLPPPPPPPLFEARITTDQSAHLLPPPPPLEDAKLRIVTLDDLFRKTKATPCIYYLPLSEEEVSSKLSGAGKISKR